MRNVKAAWFEVFGDGGKVKAQGGTPGRSGMMTVNVYIRDNGASRRLVSIEVKARHDESTVIIEGPGIGTQTIDIRGIVRQ